MTRYERKIYSFGVVIAAILIIAIVAVLTEGCVAETAVYAAPMVNVEDFTEETAKEPEIGQIRDSAMPCDDPDAFAKWLETYEAETTPEIPHLYSVNGDVMQEDLQEYLFQKLSEHEIEWFMPYAIMIAYQESHFDCYAQNPNGLDLGLFQFRKSFWDWDRGDIFDPYIQIDVFTENMARRSEIGCDVYEMISRHNVSDYGSYNHEYVATVLSHERRLEIIGK